VRLPITEDNRRWWTLIAMCFALFMAMLDNTVVNVALPTIQRDLHMSISGLEWTVNAYTLALAVLLVTGGRLGDLFGRVRVFLIGVVVFAVSSGLIALAQSEEWLVAWRAVQGVGAACMMPATLSIITNAFGPEERGKAIGTWAGVSALALAIGPVVGGFLVEHVSWQSIFLLNLPVAVVAVLVTLAAAHESRDETVARGVDVPGVVAVSVGLGAFVLGLVEGNAWGWDSAGVLGLFAASVVALAAFVVVERRSPAPMVDFAFFRSRQFFGANAVAFIVTFGMFALFFFLTLYMQNVLRYSALESGVRFLPTTVMIIVVAPLSGRLADRIGSRVPMTVGALLAGTALAWLSFVETTTSYAFLVVPFVLMGVGMGLVMSPMSTAAMNAIEVSKAGVASGILSMTRMVGGTFGVAVLGALITAVGRSQLEHLLPRASAGELDTLANELGAGGAADVDPSLVGPMREAFVVALHTGMRVGAAVLFVGAVVAWVTISSRRPRPAPAEAGAPAELAA
jgi:EmrB/QacA subfamily drug resistance transporter